ncbi:MULTISPECIES: YuzD family protein [Paraliobacillus]|uniref:YuzD family protein n=1 Tax=Paraliobacillus TaxID=200903 RepID=UPI000DD36E51|nr:MULTISPECIES: DUF1462 family protein [Paraliobacillus]
MSITIAVYGAEKICSSCINAPSSKETFDWIKAAVPRKFPNFDDFEYVYVDIFKQTNNSKEQNWIDQIQKDNLFYPIIVIDDQFVCEGDPRIKVVYQQIEQRINAHA